MVQLKLNKLNIIDLAVIAVILLIVAIGAACYLSKPVAVDTKLFVTVEITNAAQAALIEENAKVGDAVYLNSLNESATVTNITKADESLDITLIGPGYKTTDGYYVFEGKRILINQKAEMHGNYFVKGKVVKIENAN